MEFRSYIRAKRHRFTYFSVREARQMPNNCINSATPSEAPFLMKCI